MRRFLLPAFLLMLVCSSALGQVRIRWAQDTVYQNQGMPPFSVSGLDSSHTIDIYYWVSAPSANSCDIVSWMGIMNYPVNGVRNGAVQNSSPTNAVSTGSFNPMLEYESRFWPEGWKTVTFSVGRLLPTGFMQDSILSVSRSFYFKRTAPIPVSSYRIFPNQFDVNAPMLVEVAGPGNPPPSFAQSTLRLQDVTRRGTWYGMTMGGTALGMTTTGPNSGVFDAGSLFPAGVYDVLVRTTGECQYIPAAITVAASPTPGIIRGRVYVDRVANCRYDTADHRAPMTLVQARDSSDSRYFGMTDADGLYTIYAPYGRYQVRVVSRNGLPAHTCTQSQSAETNSTFSTVMLSSVFDSARAGDAGVSILTGIMRPGQESRIWVSTDFQGDFNLSSRVMLELDTLTAYVPDPSGLVDSVVGRRVYFKAQVGHATSGLHRSQYVTVSIPPDGNLIGRRVHVRASRIGDADADATNDTTSTVTTIVGSLDPNDKQVSPESRSPGVEGDLTYTIRFQNTGTDTAFYVAVRDTLSPLLDLSTLHGFTSTHKADYKLSGRVLEARFPFIRLVHSNRNEPASHGQFSFKVKPVAGLALGQQIENRADIYFDYNAPVRTNTATFRVQQPTALVAAKQEVLRWVPNPATDRAELRLAQVATGKLLAVDVSGKMHITGYKHTSAGIEVDLTQLRPGLYTFRFEGGATVGQLMVVR